MNRKYLFLLALAYLAAIAVSFGWADDWTLRQTPRIDFRQVEQYPPSPAIATNSTLRLAVPLVSVSYETVHFYRTIADYLSKKLNRPVVVIQRPSYAELNLLLDRNEADMAIISPGEYAQYQEDGRHDIELLVVQKRNGDTTYQSLIIVNQASHIRSLNDLRNKTFAFTDPMSLSGYVAVLHMFRQEAGATNAPDGFFSSYMFTYSLSKSLQAVAGRVVDGAAINSVAYEDAKRRDPELAAEVRILAVSPKVPTGPVVVRSNLDSATKDALRAAFLDIEKDPTMATALRSLMYDGFVPAQPDAYDAVRAMLREVRNKP